jgi:hypothetical protein
MEPLEWIHHPSQATGPAGADAGWAPLARIAAMTRLSKVEPVEAVLSHPHGLLEAPRLGSDGVMVYSDVRARIAPARARCSRGV